MCQGRVADKTFIYCRGLLKTFISIGAYLYVSLMDRQPFKYLVLLDVGPEKGEVGDLGLYSAGHSWQMLIAVEALFTPSPPWDTALRVDLVRVKEQLGPYSFYSYHYVYVMLQFSLCYLLYVTMFFVYIIDSY